ncbi:MAG: hypothetical protein HKO79_06000 [Desulfobacterales bacterium]|nr:hypothetical protein [Desulfobacterales bacterium]
MPTPIFVGEIEEDSEKLWVSIDTGSQDSLREYRKKFKFDQKFKIVIRRLTKSKVRSVEQNAYYWGVVIKMLADHFGYIGPGEKDDLHEAMRSKFLVYQGKFGPQVMSTTQLDTATFERYLEAIRFWAAVNYDIKIPMPNQVDTPDGELTQLGEAI